MRHSPFPRREYWRLLWLWLRKNVKPLAVVVALWIMILVAASVALRSVPMTDGSRGYWTGFVHAGLAGTMVVALLMTFLIRESTAIHQLRGAWGEDFTRDELKKARRHHAVWSWVDSITLQYGDIDHIVITRSGGILAVDSKWSSDTSGGTASSMAQAATKVRLRAEAVVQTVLGSPTRSSHRATGKAFAVRPVVVVWGAAQSALAEPREINGVDFVPGCQFAPWLAERSGDPVDKAAAKDLIKRIRQFRDTSRG